MKITIIGQSTCIPDHEHEAACALIDGKHLVDTGWCSAQVMRAYGFDPLALESILLTHLHQDHYLGLPALLFYHGLRGQGDPSPLRIAGPREYLDPVVRAALDFLQVERFPEIAPNLTLLPLSPGDRFTLDDLTVETFAARHVSGHNRLEPALAYRFTNAAGKSIVFSGDTHPHPPLAEFARGAEVLIHDGAHTPAHEAAAIARDAGVGRLLLTHYREEDGPGILREARELFTDTDLAEEGMTLLL
ncbi:MAG TPA: MBL fold metallo-hydrolase [Armatimonadetes bacterium]|jgi:ribonuclease BN (tRNA processing enzyme)|nr:MBL fold metallo-hydrolase [Armatimonadota bacterium]